MTAARIAIALVLLVIVGSIGVGAATSPLDARSSQVGGNEPTAMGATVTSFMQANAAQAQGSVDNGMWAAAYAGAPNDSAKRQLVERRIGSLDRSLAELQAERRAIREAFENGSMNRTTYRARLSAVVGELAAFDDGVGDASDRGRAVGVNVTRLDALRSHASELSGPEVSALARNLTGGPPGQGALFAGALGRPGAGNGSSTDGSDDGPPGQGPPDDHVRSDEEPSDEATATPTTDEED